MEAQETDWKVIIKFNWDSGHYHLLDLPEQLRKRPLESNMQGL